jgi:hypothetical protein
MNEDLKETALRVARESLLTDHLWLSEKYEGYDDEVEALNDYTEKLLAALPKSEPVAWEYRRLDTNEYTVTHGQWLAWERVLPRNFDSAVEDRVAEIQHYIDKGYKYELRALYTTPPDQSARIAELERENDTLRKDAERERCLSFRNQVAELERENAETLRLCEMTLKMLLSEPDTKGALFKAENLLREAIAETKRNK